MHNRLTFECFNGLDRDKMQKIIETRWHHEAVSGILCHFAGCVGAVTVPEGQLREAGILRQWKQPGTDLDRREEIALAEIAPVLTIGVCIGDGALPAPRLRDPRRAKDSAPPR
jgi:hypothetical protein